VRLCILAVLVLAGAGLAMVLFSAVVWLCGGEVGSPEGGRPDAVEIVLGFAQVQGEGVIQQAESCQGLLQAVDGAGGGLEVVVQVGGGGVVGGAFGQQPPLLALAPPVEQVGPGQDEFVAVVAAQAPGAGAAVDDGLEGAEPALGRSAAAGQVDREGLGLRAAERGGIPGEQLTGFGRGWLRRASLVN
jgi:hypothetical protein